MEDLKYLVINKDIKNIKECNSDRMLNSTFILEHFIVLIILILRFSIPKSSKWVRVFTERKKTKHAKFI